VKRSRIATRLIESVVDQEDETEVSAAWQAEIERRIESIQNGTAKLTTNTEVMANLRPKLVQQSAAKAA
jgi:putative addiction module component (TIGR02574 family)